MHCTCVRLTMRKRQKFSGFLDHITPGIELIVEFSTDVKQAMIDLQVVKKTFVCFR